MFKPTSIYIEPDLLVNVGELAYPAFNSTDDLKAILTSFNAIFPEKAESIWLGASYCGGYDVPLPSKLRVISDEMIGEERSLPWCADSLGSKWWK